MRSFFNFKLKCLIFFITTCINGYSQQISGRILDSKNNAIPYAHIVWGKSDKGSISNDSGFFKLNIPKGFSTVNISSIGFENRSLQLSELSKNKLNIIELEDSKTSMDEVIVKGTFDSATWYVKRAIKKIPKNYSRKKYSQVAFYREASIRDSIYSRIVEALVLVSDRGINVPTEKTKYEVLRLRKTKDERNIGWRQSLSNWLYQDAGVYAVNKSNPVKPKRAKNSDANETLISPSTAVLRKESPFRLFNEAFIEDNLFDIVARYEMNGEDFIKVEFKRSGKEMIKYFKTGGSLIINKSDFAIVEFNRWVKGQIGNEKENKNKFRAQYLIKFKKIDGKYYTYFIRDMVVGSNASRIFGIADRKEFIESNGKKGRIYTVNEWYVLENRDYERINWRQEMSKDDDIYDIDPTKRLGITFDDINTTPINPISQKMLNDLTNNNSIDALFTEE